MNSFDFQCVTKIVFGRDTQKRAASEITAAGGSRVLVVYGGASVKKSGLLDGVLETLRESGLFTRELGGIVPNPRVSKVREGITLCKEYHLDFLLAVGGGSVIDTAKAISFGACYDGDVWDFLDGTAKPGSQRIPVGTILTLPAAGSEASDSCVISDEEKQIKTGFGSPLMRPVFSILNPELTMTLPPFQTACGCMDMLAHVMERYFTKTAHVELTDRLCEAVMKTVVNNLPKALENPADYDTRAEIMWAGTLAQNDLVGTGRGSCWFNHGLEHQISGFYDIAHGAGLSISYPSWLRFVCRDEGCLEKLYQWAVRVWDVVPSPENPQKAITEGIDRFEQFLTTSGLPVRLREVNIGSDHFEDIADRLTGNGAHTAGGYYAFKREEILDLLECMR